MAFHVITVSSFADFHGWLVNTAIDLGTDSKRLAQVAELPVEVVNGVISRSIDPTLTQVIALIQGFNHLLESHGHQVRYALTLTPPG